MDKKNNNPEKFAELLAAYRKGHAEQGQFLSYVDRLSAQVRNNTICGSYKVITFSKTIIKTVLPWIHIAISNTKRPLLDYIYNLTFIYFNVPT